MKYTSPVQNKTKIIIWFCLSFFLGYSQLANATKTKNDPPPKLKFKIVIETNTQHSLIPLLKKIMLEKQNTGQLPKSLMENKKTLSATQLLSLFPTIKKAIYDTTCDSLSIEKNVNIVIPALNILQKIKKELHSHKFLSKDAKNLCNEIDSLFSDLSSHFDKLINKQKDPIDCDPCDDPCSPALECEGIKQINLHILHNVCSHHLTIESKLDLIDSKIEELFEYITIEHEITRETIIDRLSELHVTMESKLDLIDSKIGVIIENGGGGSCDCVTQIFNNSNKTINESGSYILCENIDGPINIDTSDVSLNLNGYTVNATPNGIVVNSTVLDKTLINITIFDGYVEGTNPTGSGIVIARGSSIVKIKNVNIRNLLYGIIFMGLSDQISTTCKVENCIIELCQFGLFGTYLQNSTFENVEITNFASTGFYLLNSPHNCFNWCKAKGTGSYGFYIAQNSNNNTFTHCVAEDINSTGFDINANETKLIDCVISNIIGAGASVYGIKLGSAGEISGAKIVNCIIKNIGYEDSTFSAGISLVGEKSVIENNNIGIIKGKSPIGIFAPSTTSNNNIIVNNTIYEIVGIEGLAYGIQISTDAINNVVHKNLISNIFPKSNGTTIMGSAIFADEITNLISRNISYNNDEDGTSTLGASFWDFSTSAPMVNSDHMFSTAEDYFNTWYP